MQVGVVSGDNALQNELGATPDLEAGDPLAVTRADPNRDLTDDAVTAFAPGVQFFFGGRNKLALNWDFISFGGGLDSENSFKAQYQFHF